MCWNLANPFDTGIPHGRIRVQATGYGLLNQDLLALVKPLDLALLDLDCLINLRGFLVYKDGLK